MQRQLNTTTPLSLPWQQPLASPNHLELLTMSPLALLPLILAGTSVMAASVDMSVFGPRYAPQSGQFSSLTDVLNGTGAPGIYNSSSASDDEYGVYNWCNMPHVRGEQRLVIPPATQIPLLTHNSTLPAKEYVVPSSDYTLEYVEVIHRHHKRTPYGSNVFPVEDITWDCSSNGPFAYARNASGSANRVAPVSWQASLSEKNPWAVAAPVGFPGSSCQFPQITAVSFVACSNSGLLAHPISRIPALSR